MVRARSIAGPTVQSLADRFASLNHLTIRSFHTEMGRIRYLVQGKNSQIKYIIVLVHAVAVAVAIAVAITILPESIDILVACYTEDEVEK